MAVTCQVKRLEEEQQLMVFRLIEELGGGVSLGEAVGLTKRAVGTPSPSATKNMGGISQLTGLEPSCRFSLKKSASPLQAWKFEKKEPKKRGATRDWKIFQELLRGVFSRMYGLLFSGPN